MFRISGLGSGFVDTPSVPSPITRLDQVALFGRPRLWFALFAVLALLLAGLAWTVFARAPITIVAGGVISTEGGPVNVGTSLNGTVTNLYVRVGESVEIGNNIIAVRDDSGRTFRVQSPISGVVIEISTQLGDFVNVGDTVSTLQNKGEKLEAIAFAPVSTVGGIKVGQQARVAPDSVPIGEYGLINGVVTSIGSTPMSQARLNQLVGNSPVALAQLVSDQSVIEVRIRLDRNDDNPSGFAWTIGSGPAFTLLSGTPWSGDVLLGSTSPLAIMLGL